MLSVTAFEQYGVINFCLQSEIALLSCVTCQYRCELTGWDSSVSKVTGRRLYDIASISGSGRDFCVI